MICLNDLGYIENDKVLMKQDSVKSVNQNEISKKQMYMISKTLTKILYQTFSNSEHKYLDPETIKMILVYIGLMKSTQNISFPLKFKQHIVSNLQKLSLGPRNMVSCQQLLNQSLEDPFLSAFPSHLFNSTLKALRNKDFRKALRFGMLLKIHNQMIPKEQLLLLWSAVSAGLEDNEECINMLSRLSDLAMDKQDWKHLNQYYQIKHSIKAETSSRKQTFGYSAKVMEELGLSSPRQVCLSSGVLVQDKERMICKVCRFVTLREEILKKKLMYCGLCRNPLE
jgi:hypothetical protein